MPKGTFRSALAHSSFTIALVAYALTSAAVGMGAVVVSVALYQRGGSAAWATLGAVTRVAPFIVLSSISGAVADRHDHRRVLRVAFAVQVLLAVVLAFGANHAPLLAVAGIGLASHAAWTIAYPTVASLVPRLMEADDLAPANGLLSTVESLAWIAGPGIGGLIITTAGFATASIVQACLAAAGVALTWVLIVRRSQNDTDRTLAYPSAAKERLLPSIRNAFATIVGSSAVIVPLSLLLTSNLIYGAVQVLLLVAATDRLGMSEGGYGALTAAWGAGAFAALLVINRAARSQRPTTVLAGSVVVSGLPVAVIAFIHVPAIVVVLLFISGVGMVLTDVLALTALQRNVPMEKVARVFGVLDSLMVGTMLVGSTLASPVISAIGIQASLVLLGGLLPVVAAFAAPRLAKGREAAAVDLDALAPTIGLLAGLPVLRHASPAAIEAIAAESSRQLVEPGEVVIRQGDETDHFYAIVEGQMDVTVRHTDGTIDHVRTMGPGVGFGELGLLHGTPRTATVTAATAATLVRVPGESFLRALGPGLAMGGIGPGAAIRDYVMAR
jgi:MFS family permease